MATEWDTWQLCTIVFAKPEVGISPHSLCGCPWVNVYNSVRRISRWRSKFPRDMVCLRNICINTLRKRDNDDDNDDDDDDNNNNNNNNNNNILDVLLTCSTVAIANSASCLVVVTTPMGIPGRFQRAASLRTLVFQTKLRTNKNIHQ